MPALADAPEATVAVPEVSQADIANTEKGISFSGTGFTAESTATVTVIGTDGTEYAVEDPLTVTPEGEVNGVFFFETTDAAKVPTGTYTLFLTDTETKEDSSKVTFDVVEKVAETPAPAPSPTECATPSATPTPSETPSEAAPPETADPSESATPSATPSETATPSATPSETASPTPSATPSETATPTPSETGTASPTPTETGDNEKRREAPAPTPSATPSAPESQIPTPSTSSLPAGDDAVEAAAFSIAIDPTEISSSDFADADKGVTITVTGAQPGEQITVQVEHAQGQVERFQIDKVANEQGNAVVGVHAADDPVLGEYRVTAFGPESEAQAGSFTVVTNSTSVGDEAGNRAGGEGNGSGGGSGSGGSSDSGTALPRTGSEMTGLALGAGLLVVGAAAVVVTRRRTRSTDPADV